MDQCTVQLRGDDYWTSPKKAAHRVSPWKGMKRKLRERERERWRDWHIEKQTGMRKGVGMM